jgi:hypothetical protein
MGYYAQIEIIRTHRTGGVVIDRGARSTTRMA